MRLHCRSDSLPQLRACGDVNGVHAVSGWQSRSATVALNRDKSLRKRYLNCTVARAMSVSLPWITDLTPAASPSRFQFSRSVPVVIRQSRCRCRHDRVPLLCLRGFDIIINDRCVATCIERGLDRFVQWSRIASAGRTNTSLRFPHLKRGMNPRIVRRFSTSCSRQATDTFILSASAKCAGGSPNCLPI